MITSETATLDPHNAAQCNARYETVNKRLQAIEAEAKQNAQFRQTIETEVVRNAQFRQRAIWTALSIIAFVSFAAAMLSIARSMQGVL